jgi:outer membrane protein assembly factor BamB
VQCPNCGAKLDAPEVGEDLVCKFCQHRLRVGEPPPPPPTPAPPLPSPPRRAPLAGLISLLFTLGIGAIVARTLWKSGVVPSSVSSMISKSGGRILWDDVGGPPQLVSLPGGEAMVGRIRGDGDQLAIIAVDGKTGDLLWRGKPLGTYGEAYRDTRFAVVGSRVVVSEVHSKLLILDAVSGALQKEVALTDRVRLLCADGDAHAFAATVDGKDVSVDVAAGSATSGKRPRGCSDEFGFSRAAPSVRAPKVDGMQAHASFSDGQNGVIVGSKHPGTAVPMAAGFDPATLTVRWRSNLASVDAVSVRDDRGGGLCALAGGRLVDVYGVGDKGWRLVALDAASGAHVWETELPRIFAVDQVSAVRATPTRVYVVHMSSLEIYDAQSGKKVAIVGDETYEH